MRFLLMKMTSGDDGLGERASRVLLVDDETDLLEVLSFELGELGYEVTAVPNGSEAVEAARRRKFDVVITDLRMPGMDGVETMTTLKQIDPGLPIIVATGYASEGARLAFDARGAYEVILKPFTVGEIVRLMDRAIADRHVPTEGEVTR